MNLGDLGRTGMWRGDASCSKPRGSRAAHRPLPPAAEELAREARRVVQHDRTVFAIIRTAQSLRFQARYAIPQQGRR
jgi:hypothetical protein